MTEDKIEAEVSEKGAKLYASGAPAKKVTKALIDLISPFTEGAGILGDLIRVYRETTVRAALVRAERIAIERQITGRQVPAKYLIDWIEKTSMENDDALIETWAELLVASVVGFDSELFLFNEFVHKLNSNSVKLITAIGSGSEAGEVGDGDCLIRIRKFIQEEAIKPFSNVIEGIRMPGTFPDRDLIEEELKRLERTYPIKFSGAFTACRTHTRHMMSSQNWHVFNRFEEIPKANHELQILKQFGLVNFGRLFGYFEWTENECAIVRHLDYQPNRTKNLYTFAIDFVSLTYLGYRLYRKCSSLQ